MQKNRQISESGSGPDRQKQDRNQGQQQVLPSWPRKENAPADQAQAGRDKGPEAHNHAPYAIAEHGRHGIKGRVAGIQELEGSSCNGKGRAHAYGCLLYIA